MDILKRIWPALVVGALWLIFLALRLATPDGAAKTVSMTPQFYDYHRPAVEEKTPAKEPHPLTKETRRVQSPSTDPLPRPVQAEKSTEEKVEAPPPPTPAEPAPVKEAPPAVASKSVSAEVPSPAISTPLNPAPVVEQPAVASIPAAAVVASPGVEVAHISDTPPPAPISLDELPQAVNRTIKGAMLTIELEPPAGTDRDEFLESLGARRVNELQLWDTQVIRKYELSGQVYVFKLSGGGRVLLPPLLLARIISAIEAETNGELLYRGRILLGPQGRITVREAVKL